MITMGLTKMHDESYQPADYVLNTVKALCHARGYEIMDNSNDEIVTDKCCILFCGDRKINIGYVKQCIYIMETHHFDHLILIHKKPVTVTVKNVLKNLIDFRIEVFEEKELFFNITTHRLVPHHELVTKEERLQLDPKKGDFPQILQTDPICKFYDFKSGDIIKITRKNSVIVFRTVL